MPRKPGLSLLRRDVRVTIVILHSDHLSHVTSKHLISQISEQVLVPRLSPLQLGSTCLWLESPETNIRSPIERPQVYELVSGATRLYWAVAVLVLIQVLGLPHC